MLCLNYTLCAVKDRDSSAKLSAYIQPLLKKKNLKPRIISVPLFAIEQGSDMTDEHHTAQPFV